MGHPHRVLYLRYVLIFLWDASGSGARVRPRIGHRGCTPMGASWKAFWFYANAVCAQENTPGEGGYLFGCAEKTGICPHVEPDSVAPLCRISFDGRRVAANALRIA